MNQVAVARHELILSQNGATASRMLFKYLLGLFDVIFGPKITKIDLRTKNTEKYVILVFSGPVYFLLFSLKRRALACR